VGGGHEQSNLVLLAMSRVVSRVRQLKCHLATPLPSFRPAGRIASGIVAACQSADPWIDE
jgi:hypothetical protein